MAGLSPVCILAGGVGSRLGDAVASTPKPLLPVAGEPFVFHQLRQLAACGVELVVLSIGYLGEQIRAAVGDGSAFGIHVEYSEDGPSPIGTAGAVRKAQPLLGERFLVLYGDTYLRIDFGEVDRAALDSGLPALMTVLRNHGRWDTSNVDYRQGRVMRYDKRDPRPDMEYIDYGLSVLTASALADTDAIATDLSTLFTDLSERGLLAGYEAV
ncbi:MAG TPA: sugar phosphate nucleotidyltransferase, partial [Jatrophihabitans sp.]